MRKKPGHTGEARQVQRREVALCCQGLWQGESLREGGKKGGMWAGAEGIYPVAVQWGCGRGQQAAQAVDMKNQAVGTFTCIGHC